MANLRQNYQSASPRAFLKTNSMPFRFMTPSSTNTFHIPSIKYLKTSYLEDELPLVPRPGDLLVLADHHVLGVEEVGRLLVRDVVPAARRLHLDADVSVQRLLLVRVEVATAVRIRLEIVIIAVTSILVTALSVSIKLGNDQTVLADILEQFGFGSISVILLHFRSCKQIKF